MQIILTLCLHYDGRRLIISLEQFRSLTVDVAIMQKRPSKLKVLKIQIFILLVNLGCKKDGWTIKSYKNPQKYTENEH